MGGTEDQKQDRLGLSAAAWGGDPVGLCEASLHTVGENLPVHAKNSVRFGVVQGLQRQGQKCTEPH